MIKELAFTRKHAGEVYKFYTVKPEYEGETGCLGIVLTPYVEVETPENCFGYPDIILLTNVRDFDDEGYFVGYRQIAYTVHRYLPKHILKAIEKQMLKLASTL